MSHDPHTKAQDTRDHLIRQLERSDLPGTTALAAVPSACNDSRPSGSAGCPVCDLACKSAAVLAGDNFVRESAKGVRTGDGAADSAAVQLHSAACPVDAPSIRASLGRDVDNALGSRPATEAPAIDQAEAHKIAERIRARDLRLDRSAGFCVLENGRDLIRVKEVVGHGNFGSWCERELGYSKSKAENEMRVARVLGPYFKSLIFTDFPRSLAYILAAGTTPRAIRDEFMPRIIAGEDVGLEVKAAIEKHREQVKKAKQDDGGEPRACNAKLDDEVARNEEAQAPPSKNQAERATPAFSEALDFIVDSVGSDLPALLALLDQAGTGAVFTPAAERVLRERTAVASPSAYSSVIPLADVGEDIQRAAVEYPAPKRLDKQSPAKMTAAQQVAIAESLSRPWPRTLDAQKRRAS